VPPPSYFRSAEHKRRKVAKRPDTSNGAAGAPMGSSPSALSRLAAHAVFFPLGQRGAMLGDYQWNRRANFPIWEIDSTNVEHFHNE
jgi:hypothetical protein